MKTKRVIRNQKKWKKKHAEEVIRKLREKPNTRLRSLTPYSLDQILQMIKY